MQRTPVLPVHGSRLAALPDVREQARRDAARLGLDLLDDAVATRVVADHLRLRSSGGWHDELGGVLVIGGAVAAAILAGSLGSPVEPRAAAAFGLACAAVPLGVLVWFLGNRLGARKRLAAERFAAYDALLARARQGGTAVPVPAGWHPGPGRAESGGDARGRSPLLPAQVFAQDQELRWTAARLGAEHRIDYLDEPAVRALLAAQQRSVGRIRLWAGLLTLGLTATGGAVGIGLTLTAGSPGRNGVLAAAAVLGLLTVVPLGQLLRAVRGWRGGVRDGARGYLALLAAARARGVAVPAPPSWLDTAGTARTWR